MTYVFDWLTTRDWPLTISVIKDLVIILATIITIYQGINTLKLWRKQIRGKDKHEILKNINKTSFGVGGAYETLATQLSYVFRLFKEDSTVDEKIYIIHDYLSKNDYFKIYADDLRNNISYIGGFGMDLSYFDSEKGEELLRPILTEGENLLRAINIFENLVDMIEVYRNQKMDLGIIGENMFKNYNFMGKDEFHHSILLPLLTTISSMGKEI